MESAGEWCLIESDPGVFTELINGFGVRGVQFEEVIDLDYTNDVKDAHAFIFLFKCETTDTASSDSVYDDSDTVFFASQVIHNACATQAIINILCNLQTESIHLGGNLEQFKDFCAGFPPIEIGMALSNMNEIRSVHNSFATPNFYETDRAAKGKAEDNYHFVGFLPIHGNLYELDGLKPGPVNHGEIPDSVSWIDYFVKVLKQRMESSPGVMFNLLALVPDRLLMYTNKVAEMEAAGSDAEYWKALLQQEQITRRNYARDQVCRRHNYLPLIIELLKLMARERKLVPAVKAALEKALEIQNSKKAKKEVEII